MSTFAFLFLCIQACLVQNVFGTCLGGLGYRGLAAPGIAAPAWGGLAAPAVATPAWGGLAAPAVATPAWGGLGYGYEAGWAGSACGSYGGAGIGNVAVAGELPVAGTTVVAGQVPIIGAVGFGGDALAAGAVSIAGRCGCGCGAPYVY